MKKIKLLIMLAVLTFSAGTFSNSHMESLTERINYHAALNQTNALKNLSIDGVNLDFKEDTLEYTLEVPYSMTEAIIHYEAYEKDSIVEVVGGKQLYLGNNSIAILVTSGYDGSVREYDITLIRKDDSVDADNKIESIEEMLENAEGSTVVVNVTGNGATISENVSKVLKESLKTLVYDWKDSKGKFYASLTIDGSKVKNTNPINPNVKSEINDEKLKKYVEGYDYTPISTVGLNLPDGSIYKLSIDGDLDVYYMYYYDNGILNKKPLRNVNGTVEFELENDMEYALMVSASHPNKKFSGENIGWLLPSVMVTVLVILIFIITRIILVKVLKVQSIPTRENLEKKSEK
ncbi:MAG TPA: hypothetical protein DCY94_00780 [Firmicutes bacterium]|nr:hypothetical protein [Bacillota bacterium]